MSTRIKAIIILLLISILPLAGLFFITSKKMSEIIEEQTRQQLNLANEFAEGYIINFFEKIKAQASEWAADDYIRSELELINSSTLNIEEANNLGVYLKTKKRIFDPAVITTDVIDPSGKIIASTDGNRVGGSLFFRDVQQSGKASDQLYKMKVFLLINGSEQGEAFVSELPTDKDLGSAPFLSVISPLTSEKTGQLVGVLVNHVSIAELNKFLSGQLQTKMTADFYLVNRQGNILTTPKYSAVVNLNKKQVSVPPMVACFSEKKDYQGHYKNYAGIPVIGVSECPNNQWWLLVAEVAEKDISVATKKYYQAIILMIGPIAILILAGIFFGYHLISRNRKNMEVLERIQQGYFDVRADEDGNDEIAKIGRGINQMAARIQQLDLINETKEKLKH